MFNTVFSNVSFLKSCNIYATLVVKLLALSLSHTQGRCIKEIIITLAYIEPLQIPWCFCSPLCFLCPFLLLVPVILQLNLRRSRVFFFGHTHLKWELENNGVVWQTLKSGCRASRCHALPVKSVVMELLVNKFSFMSLCSSLLLVSKNSRLSLSVTVMNRKENAYNTRVIARFSSNLFYSSVTPPVRPTRFNIRILV